MTDQRPPRRRPRRASVASLPGTVDDTPDELASPRNARGTRPRHVRIDVWLTPEERDAIKERADGTTLSLSAYLRTAGLHQPIRSLVDLDATRALSAADANLGRLGGLLKMFMSDQRAIGGSVVDANKVLADCRAEQDRIKKIIAKVLRG